MGFLEDTVAAIANFSKASLPWAGLDEQNLGNPTFNKPETPDWSGLDEQNLGNYTYNPGQTTSGSKQQPASDPLAFLDEQNRGNPTISSLPWAVLDEQNLGNLTFNKPETLGWNGLDEQNLGNYTYSVSPYSGVSFNTESTASKSKQQQQEEQPASGPWVGLDEQNYGTFTLGDLQNAMSGAYANAGLRQGDESYYYNLDDEGNRPGEQSAEGFARQEDIRGKASNANAALNQGLGDQFARWIEGSEDVVGPVSNSYMNVNAVKQSKEYKDINAKLNRPETTPEERQALLEQRKALENGAIDTSTGERLPEYEAPTDMQRAYSVLENAFGVDPTDYEALAQFVNANKDASTLGDGQTLNYNTFEADVAKGPASQAIAETTATQGTDSDPAAVVNAAQEAQMTGENDRADISVGGRPAIENAIAQAMAESGDDYLDWVPSEIYARFLEEGGGNAQAYPTLLDFQLDSSQEEFYEFIEVCNQLYGMYSSLFTDGQFDQDKYDIWWADCKAKNILGDQRAHDVFCVDYQNSEAYIDALYGGKFSQARANGYSEDQVRAEMALQVRAAIIQAMEMNMQRDSGTIDSTFGNGMFTTGSTWTPSVAEDMLERLYGDEGIDVGTYEEGGEYSAHNNANASKLFENGVDWDRILGSQDEREQWANDLNLNNMDSAALEDVIMQMMIARNQAANKQYRG